MSAGSKTEGEGGGRRRGLAKGLSALLGDAAGEVLSEPGEATPRALPIEFLRPSRLQPRRRFDEDEIKALAESIRTHGVLQPLVVRSDSEVSGSYEIVSGERRWRAAQIVQLHEIPVVVRELGDKEVLEVALIENIQRENLTPLEEAEGFQRLIDDFGHSQEALGRAVGKSRSHVANMLRLLGLPDALKTLLDEGQLSAGHARALLGAPEPEVLAREVLRRGLNVRETERLVRARAAPRRARAKSGDEAGDADLRALERRIGDRLGLAVRLRHKGPGGRIEIEYRSQDQLDDLLRRLGCDED